MRHKSDVVIKGENMTFALISRAMRVSQQATVGGNRSVRRKTCPSANLSATNFTWTELGGNPGLHHGGRRLTD